MDNNDTKIDLLKEKISQIDELLKDVNWEMLRQWKEEALMILDHIITEDSKYYKGFENIQYRSGVVQIGDPEVNKARHKIAYESGLKSARASLQAVVFGIKKGLF